MTTMTTVISDTKRCTKCGIEKLLTEFSVHPHSKDGRHSYCKACQAAYMQQYRQEHHQELREHHRQYDQEHRDERAAHDRQYHKEHPEECQEYHRQCYKEHREEYREHHQQYYQEHPEVLVAARRRRRALEYSADGSYTTEEFTVLCEYMDWRCTYCGCELTAETVTEDHMIPLSRGGSNYIDNITPACKSCNSKKRNKTVEEYLEYLGRGTR